jgi:hypothetical protein
MSALVHFSDLPIPVTNVGYQGKSGSNSDIAKSTRLSLSGNEQRGARQRLGALVCFIVALKFLSQRRDDAMDCFYQGPSTSCK